MDRGKARGRVSQAGPRFGAHSRPVETRTLEAPNSTDQPLEGSTPPLPAPFLHCMHKHTAHLQSGKGGSLGGRRWLPHPLEVAGAEGGKHEGEGRPVVGGGDPGSGVAANPELDQVFVRDLLLPHRLWDQTPERGD